MNLKEKLREWYFKYIQCEHKSREHVKVVPTYYGSDHISKCLDCGRQFSRGKVDSRKWP